jgi:hypothetical protein
LCNSKNSVFSFFMARSSRGVGGTHAHRVASAIFIIGWKAFINQYALIMVPKQVNDITIFHFCLWKQYPWTISSQKIPWLYWTNSVFDNNEVFTALCSKDVCTEVHWIESIILTCGSRSGQEIM